MQNSHWLKNRKNSLERSLINKSVGDGTGLCQTTLCMSLDCLLQKKDWPERKLEVREQKEGKNPWDSFSLKSTIFSKFSNFHTLHAHTSTNKILRKWIKTSSEQKKIKSPNYCRYNTDKITTTFLRILWFPVRESCMWAVWFYRKNLQTGNIYHFYKNKKLILCMLHKPCIM